ncbi:MAG: membrane protein insertase YidC [Bdellovibrionales bacterium]|nr:membrane protein insertase YidC [Bdellovibrionales bacterium]
MDPITEQENHRKALALIICLFVGFMYWESVWKPYFNPTLPSAPRGEQVAAPKPAATPDAAEQFLEPSVALDPMAASDLTAEADKPGTAQQPTAPAAEMTRYPSDARVSDAGVIEVTTSKYKANLSLLGGRLTDLYLLEYAAKPGNGAERLNLVTHAEHAPHPLGVYSGGVDDSWTTYQVVEGVQGSAVTVTAEAAEVVLQGTLPDGRGVTKRLTFAPDSYVLDVAVELSAPAADSGRALLEWTHLSTDAETSLLDPYNVTGYAWFNGEKALREAYGKFEGIRQELGPLRWIAQADKYFMAALVAPNELAPGYALRTGSLWRSRLAGEPTSVQLKLVVGPKQYERLEDLGYELQRVIDFGYTGFVAAPLLSLLHVAYSVVGNYGLAIILLTILVRLALYPLAAASFKQMRAMQDLKPEIDRVREQITDKQQQQMELMALYKKKGVNPLGGCLPVLLQMPIFIGLYSALMLSVELRGADFALWITDLSAPEKLMIGGVGIPVMVILFVISMMVQQWTTPSAMDPTQKKVMMVMPLVFGFMFARFPAGLTLYWLTSNLISIGQQKGMYASSGPSRSALYITLGVSAAVFVFAFIITLI